MRVLATIFVTILLCGAVFSQTAKPKTVVKPKPKAADTKSKTSVAKPKTSQKLKATDAKSKSAASKSKTPPTKAKASDNKSKTASGKSKPADTKPKPKAKATATHTPTPNPKTNIVKPKATAVVPKADEKTEWEKAIGTAAPAAKVLRLKKFNAAFPKSANLAEAQAMIVTTQAMLGNDRVAADDLAGAAAFYKAATKDAPKPVPDELFTETLSKFAANLYFRGARAEAFEVAKAIEERVDANVGQLLNVAAFYMSVENGSEARRIAELAIKTNPASATAYQTLGLANRMDFRLDESAAAYAKALELDPESLSARRGLAEMKRSSGKADEALVLYREILARDAENLPAQTGQILSLFDADKRTEAEAELAKSLEGNPGNVILLAGAAYWYAARNEGDKAVELAQKALAADPRFIWSHIALARGHMAKRDPIAAEKALIAARRYGNFPTLEYELASARLAAGFYREAAEEMAKSFSVKQGLVHANLGGRVPRDLKNITELIGFERRASIFAPTAADNPENAARLTALLELKQELESAQPRVETVSRAADDFIRGDDKMKVHRQIFAATQLLEKRVALPKVVEIAKAAPPNLDAGLDIPNASVAIMAAQLYENRALAAARGDYINVPEIPKSTLSAVLRGQVEDLMGWAVFNMNNAPEAVIRLKRAVSVLPGDSAWWRTSTWRLGAALAHTGKDAEALDWYIRSYKSGAPNAFAYSVIEAAYRRVSGSTEGLDARIGANPAVPAQTVVAKLEPTPEVKIEPAPETVRAITRLSETPPPSVPIAKPIPTATVEIKTEPTPTPQSTPTPEIKIEPTPEAVQPLPSATVTPESTPLPAAVKPEVTPTPTPTPEPSVTPVEKPVAVNIQREIFPPVVITIPPPTTRSLSPTPTPTPEVKSAESQVSETSVAENKPETPLAVVPRRPRFAEENVVEPVKPCSLTVSEETVTLQNGGSDIAVIVGRTDDEPVEGLTAASTSPTDVVVRREAITGVKSRALFVLSSKTSKTGIFQVRFELPCGKRDVNVRVR